MEFLLLGFQDCTKTGNISSSGIQFDSRSSRCEEKKERGRFQYYRVFGEKDRIMACCWVGIGSYLHM
jgi:hypothetical protein